jgi:uncharacterized protein (TIGR04562 family)
LEALDIASLEQAHDFANSYGFDPCLPRHKSKIFNTFSEALNFLERVILEDTDTKTPPQITKAQDPIDLLIWASQKPRNDIACWACAVLRIMHTLLYIDNNLVLSFIPDIHHQILERYDRHIVQGPKGKWVLKGAYEVPIVEFRRKEHKNKDSILLKLLHKPENVAETIYDNIGIRIVAEDLLGVLMVLSFLIDHNVIQAAHIKPSRTRNLMIDPILLEEWMGTLPEGFSIGDLKPPKRKEICERLAQRIGRPAVNPYSSRDYSALQITANTLVRLSLPGISELGKVQEIFSHANPDHFSQFHIPELIQGEDGISFFFAHEVQLMEKSGFTSANLGPASHAEYKRRQREVVRRRLLRGLLPHEGLEA